MTSQREPHQHLFTLRLWREEDAEGQTTWRGRIHHTDTGNIRYFRGWPALIPLLLSMLRQTKPDANSPSDATDETT